MRWALLAGLLAGCYHSNNLACAVTCANNVCPSGLVCGADQLCHAGSRECSEIDAIDARIADDAGPVDAPSDAPSDAPPLAFCDPRQPNLVACYEFEGTGADSTSHHLDAKNTTSFKPGKVGRALEVGVTSMVRVLDSPLLDLGRFTVEAWINQQATMGSNVAVVATTAQYGIFVDVADEPLCSNVYTSSTLPAIARSATPLPRNTWTHVACSYDGMVLTLYVNGSVDHTLGMGGVVSQASVLGLGMGSDDGNTDPSNHFIGLIDQVRITSAPRTAAEICADAGRTPPCL